MLHLRIDLKCNFHFNALNLILILSALSWTWRAPRKTPRSACGFASGLELGNLVVSSGLLHLSWSSIRDLYTEVNRHQQPYLPLHLRWRVDRQPKGTIVAFVTSSLLTEHHLEQEGNLVSSDTLRQENFNCFDFLTSEGSPSFFIHKAAMILFATHVNELLQLRTQLHDANSGKLLVEAPLVITGHSLGGSVAALFTLWLLDLFSQPSTKLPLLCITFGSPLLGDKGLQRAISEFSTYGFSFLHVVAAKDPIPRLFISANDPPASPYKPFGTFLLCSEHGCTCSNDSEAVSELLKATKSASAIGQFANEGLPMDYYGKMVEHLECMVISKDIAQSGPLVEDSLHAGIILQLESVRDEMIQNNGIHYLIKMLEAREKACMLNRRKGLCPMRKLNEVKIRMAYLGWYKKGCRNKGIGYYDSYKNLMSNSDMDVAKYKKFLTNYWKEMIEEAERMLQKEGANIRMTWLFAGTNYRRMVEPLDIAEYYRENGRRDYQTHGRSKHYILLEQWQKEDARKNAGPSSNKNKKNVGRKLTEDSCFWAKVEEGLIVCKIFKDATASSSEKTSSTENLVQFAQYVMNQINDYAVSPEIFLEQSSFMKWWKEFVEIMGTSYNSPLVEFMKSGRYDHYARGCF